MRPLHKFFITVAAAVPMLFVPSSVGHADTFGVADGALLIQQIAQFVQDADMGFNAAQVVTDKLSEVKQIANVLAKIKGAGDFMQTLIDVVDMGQDVVHLYNEVLGYYNYLRVFGSSIRADNCYNLYMSFTSRTGNLIMNASTTITGIVSMFMASAEPLDLMGFLKNFKDGIKESLGLIVTEDTTKGAEMVLDETVVQAKEADANLNACVFAAI